MDINFQLIDTFFGSVHLLKELFENKRAIQRLFCAKSLMNSLVKVSQVNHSRQPWQTQWYALSKSTVSEKKIIRCIAGEVWDVFVDVRPESQTF